MEPTIIKIENEKYFNAEDLKNFDIAFFNKINTSIRKIITIKKIPNREYNYFCFNKKENKWKESDKEKPSPKAKLFIKEEWSKQNIPKFNEELKNEYEEAPPILKLKDEEKFKDIENNILNIEVIGERDEENCYFKVKDISNKFDAENLSDTLKDKRNNYNINEHYKFFITKKSVSHCENNSKNKSKKTMYLTYLGLIRMLFVSRNKNAVKFQKWAAKILFTHQMGTIEQKQILSNKLLGTPVKIASETLKISSSPVPAVYLLTFGTVKTLRKTFNIPENIPDDTILCKYGRTEDLQRRIVEHDNDYGKMENVELRLVYYAYIDPQFINEAENQLKAHFTSNNMKFDFPNRNELVFANPNLLKNTLKIYDLINNACSGSFREINNKMKELEQKLVMKDMQHDFEIKEKNHEINKLKTAMEHQNEIIKLKEQIYNLKK